MTKTGIFRRHALCTALVLLSALLVVPACKRQSATGRELWAEVDGKPIFRDQVERYYRSRMAPGSDTGSPEQALSFKLNVLNELINDQILVAHAARSRITVSEAEVDTKVAELRSPYSREEFQRKLTEQGFDADSLREEVRQNLIINKLVNKEIASRINLTDREMAEYYGRNKATFNVPETQYHLAQIAVTPVAEPQTRNTKNDDAKNPQAAERKIQALYARVRSGKISPRWRRSIRRIRARLPAVATWATFPSRRSPPILSSSRPSAHCRSARFRESSAAPTATISSSCWDAKSLASATSPILRSRVPSGRR